MENIINMNINFVSAKTSNIKVLCVLDYLPIAGKGNFKEGVYPTILKAHHEAGIRIGVAVHKLDDIEEQIKACSHLCATFIPPKQNIEFKKFINYVRFIRYVTKKTWIKWFVFIWRNRQMLAGIEEYIKLEGRPDVIAGFTAIENTGMSAFLIAKLYNIPYVVRENRTYYTRGLIKGNLEFIIRDVIKSVGLIFAVSPQLAENIRKCLSIDAHNIVVLQNPVAENFFIEPEYIEWVKDFSKGRFIFAGWTNWRDIKRIDIAIKALAEINAKKADSCLIIAGSVPKWVHSMIKKMNLEDTIMLTGPLNREGIISLAYGCDCCIVTSDHDPGNNSVLEAMAAGKPVIVTKCGGSESRITDSSLGRIVEKGDYKGFALAMEDVMNNISSFNSEHIHNECQRRYSTKAFGAQINSSYNALCDK